ncbi:hypothetical protein RB653_010361 [Dictyostelium firmibasis]|uniref:NOG1 N-terminal helical domain-containing protein n=1 Tax=Dictyostelium firmibasis TaxID=79012 RepID=A0AAN7YVP6_9MYCE
MATNMNVPNFIIPCEDLINKLIDMSAVSLGKLPPTVSLKTEIFNGISKLENEIIQYVTEILIEFPLLNELEPYILEQIEILIDRSKYFYSLGEVNRTIKDVEFIIDNYNLLFQNTTDPIILKNLFKSVLGRICSTLRSKSKSINYLNHSIQAFHSIPIIQDYLSTCIILGNKTDDLFFSIIMDDNNININNNNNNKSNNKTNNNIKKNNNTKYKDSYSKRYIREEDFRFDTDYDVRHSDDEDDEIEFEEEEDDDEFEEDELLNDDDYYFKSQEAVVRSYKFSDNINYSLKNEDFDNYGGGNDSTNNGIINNGNNNSIVIKPFSIATINKFQIIETPSLSTVIKNSNNSLILLEMVKALLRNVNGLILFNIDFNFSTIGEIEEQINYFINVKQFYSNQTLLIFTNCKSSKDSIDFIEFFKKKLLLSSINIEIPPIFMYEHHVSQIKEFILKFKNFPASPFIKNNLSSMFNGLTVDQQNQMDRLQQEQQRKQQQSQEIDFDILDKINKLDLN